jgi:hypothetical protein
MNRVMESQIEPLSVPVVSLPEPSDESLEAEVAQLRQMVQALSELLVECGVFDASMVEGRMRLAVEASPMPRPKRRWWTRLLARLSAVRAAAPSSPSAEETTRVPKLPFDMTTLYDDAGSSSATSPRSPSFEEVVLGHCSRCWNHAPLTRGQLCARCAIRHG